MNPSTPKHARGTDEDAALNSLFSDIGWAYVDAPLYEKPLSVLKALVTDLPACLGSIVEDVGMRIARVCIVEIHALRIEGGYLSSRTEDQYLEFLESLRDGPARARLHEFYPGLMQAVADKVYGVVELCITVAMRYLQDYPDITRFYRKWGCQAPDMTINSVQLVGDLHPGFRGTVRLNAGCDTSIYYKNRSPRNEIFFRNIFDGLNAVANTSLSVPGFIPRAEYFWQQEAGNVPRRISSANATANVNYNLGALTVVAYATGLHDLHFENIIADEERVVVIDSECGPRQDFNMLANVREGSVSDIGILPMLISVRGDKSKICWGVMDGPPAAAPMALHIPSNVGTSYVRLVEEELPGTRVEAFPWVFLDEHWFHRGAFAAANFVAQQSYEQWSRSIFQLEGTSRFLVRSTREYGDVLRRACFRQSAKSESSRRECIRQLLMQMNSHIPEDVLAEEVMQLAREIIPAFSFDDVSPYFDASDQNSIVGRLQRNSLRDRLDQVQDAEAFASYVTHVARQQYYLCYDSRSAIKVDESKRYLSKSTDPITVGLLALERFKIPTGPGPMWSNVVEVGGAASSRAEVFDDAYNGSIGSALALSFLGVDPDYAPKCIPTIEAVLTEMMERLERGRLPVGTGVYNGLAGWMYFALCVWSSFPSMRARADDALSMAIGVLERRVKEEQVDSFDIISGDAGLLVLMKRLSTARPAHRDRCVEMVRILGKRLRGSSFDLGSGRAAWLGPDDVWLGGFSHGVAGVAFAASLWRDEGMGDLADCAWTTQLGLFDRDSGTWIDRRNYRIGSSVSGDMDAWCHGFDGVLLASAFGVDLELPFDDPFHAAVKTWAARPATDARGICHGPSSRLEVLNLLSCHSAKMESGSWVRMHDDFVGASARLQAASMRELGNPAMVEGIGEINCGLMLGLAGDLLPLRMNAGVADIAESSPLLIGLPEYRQS